VEARIRQHAASPMGAGLHTSYAEIAYRILSRCVRDGACLMWTGCKLPKGYGQMRVNMRGVQTHRMIWECRHGPIPPGLMVRHKCDRPGCCNVEHLELGTAKDNSQDMVGRGRSPRTVGERSGKAKLTAVQVAEIRRLRLAGEPCRAIGKIFGVHSAHVSRITNGLRWPD